MFEDMFDELGIPDYIPSGDIINDGEYVDFWDGIDEDGNRGEEIENSYWNDEFDWIPEKYLRRCFVCDEMYWHPDVIRNPVCSRDECKKKYNSREYREEKVIATEPRDDTEPPPIVWEAPTRNKRRQLLQDVEPMGYVYLVSAYNGLYKIGKTNDIEKRFRGLETMSPVPLKLIHAIETITPLKLEAKLHKKYDHCRAHGEWFMLSKDEVVEISAL